MVFEVELIPFEVKFRSAGNGASVMRRNANPNVCAKSAIGMHRFGSTISDAIRAASSRLHSDA